jgi:hypothetical protein
VGRSYERRVIGALLVVFGLGVLFALLYLRTSKLLLVVGIHALVNAPTMLVANPLSHEIVVALAIALLLSWPFFQSVAPPCRPARDSRRNLNLTAPTLLARAAVHAESCRPDQVALSALMSSGLRMP